MHIEIWGTILDYFFITTRLDRARWPVVPPPKSPLPAGSALFESIFTASHHIPLEHVAMPGNNAQLKPLLCSTLEGGRARGRAALSAPGMAVAAFQRLDLRRVFAQLR